MPVPVNYVEYAGRKFNISNLTYLKDDEAVDIDQLPYVERSTIEVIYTANYILEQYSDEYNLNEEQCVEVAEQAREYMDDWGCSEEEGVDEALRSLGYENDNEEEEK